jgi:hypothetical protein
VSVTNLPPVRNLYFNHSTALESGSSYWRELKF